MSKRKIPTALFEPLENIRTVDLVETSALLDLIKKETPLAIKEAFESRKTFATLFEINGLGFYLDIPKQYWIPALEQCINFMLEEEKFEECIPLKKLIDEIRQPVKTLPNKTTKKKENGAAS
jgi:hypothetical protein